MTATSPRYLVHKLLWEMSGDRVLKDATFGVTLDATKRTFTIIIPTKNCDITRVYPYALFRIILEVLEGGITSIERIVDGVEYLIRMNANGLYIHGSDSLMVQSHYLGDLATAIRKQAA